MKNHSRKPHRSQLCLGDLILTVDSCARNHREMMAALCDLLESGRVKLKSGGQWKRVRVGGQ